MPEGFTPHCDILLAWKLQVEVHDFDLLGVICSKVLRPFLGRQAEEIKNGIQSSFAQLLRDSMVYDLEEAILLTGL